MTSLADQLEALMRQRTSSDRVSIRCTELFIDLYGWADDEPSIEHLRDRAVVAICGQRQVAVQDVYGQIRYFAGPLLSDRAQSNEQPESVELGMLYSIEHAVRFAAQFLTGESFDRIAVPRAVMWRVKNFSRKA